MDSQWLNIQFKLFPDKTKAGLAEALGLEPPAISKILNDMRQIKAKEYVIMRRYFNLPVDGERAVTPPQSAQTALKPLLGETELQDGASEYDEDEADWIIPESILSQHTSAPPDSIKIFKIEDSMMAPNFKNGEYVLVDLSEKTPSPPGVFVLSDGFGYFARHCEILPLSGPKEVQVSAKDKNFSPQKLKLDEVIIAGRVLAKLQWL